MEHRHGERVRALALVRVCQSDGADECLPGLLYNVSQDGIFVLSNMQPTINASLDVYIQLAGHFMNVCLPGQVVHANGHGFGMIFRRMNRQNQWLVSLLHANYRARLIGTSIEDRQGLPVLSEVRA